MFNHAIAKVFATAACALAIALLTTGMGVNSARAESDPSSATQTHSISSDVIQPSPTPALPPPSIRRLSPASINYTPINYTPYATPPIPHTPPQQHLRYGQQQMYPSNKGGSDCLPNGRACPAGLQCCGTTLACIGFYRWICINPIRDTCVER
jgi:hypothetical protein